MRNLTEMRNYHFCQISQCLSALYHRFVCFLFRSNFSFSTLCFVGLLASVQRSHTYRYIYLKWIKVNKRLKEKINRAINDAFKLSIGEKGVWNEATMNLCKWLGHIIHEHSSNYVFFFSSFMNAFIKDRTQKL